MEKDNIYYCKGCDGFLIRNIKTTTYPSFCETANRVVSAILTKPEEIEMYKLILKYRSK